VGRTTEWLLGTKGEPSAIDKRGTEEIAKKGKCYRKRRITYPYFRQGGSLRGNSLGGRGNFAQGRNFVLARERKKNIVAEGRGRRVTVERGDVCFFARKKKKILV